MWTLLGALLVRSSIVDAAQNAAVATNISGSVAIQSTTGAIKEVTSTRILEPGDAVLTGVNSFAVVSLADVGRVVLGPGTAAVTTYSGSSLQVLLRSGLACVQAQQTSLHVASGQLDLIPAVSSTIFDLSRTADQTELAVYQGSVAATMGAAQEATYTTGTAAVSHGGQAPAPADIAAINQDFTSLGCPDESIVAAALPAPTAAPSHGGGAGGILAALLGLGAIAVAANHGGGGGSPANAAPTIGPTVTPNPSPSGVPSPTPTPSPSATPTPTPSPTPTPTPTVSPSPSPTTSPSDGLSLSPQTLTFSGPLAPSQSFTARDDAARSFSAQSGNILVAVVTQSHRQGHSARFTVSPIGPGSTNIQVSDDQGNSSAVSVSVGGPSAAEVRIRPSQPLTVQPRELMLRVGATATLNVSEDGYTGSFHLTAGQPSVVEARPSSLTGPRASFMVLARNIGTANLRLTDDRGGEINVDVLVGKN